MRVTDLEKLQCSQCYAGRRVQRFPKRSPSCSSYYGLGWLRIETYIQVKKLLFIFTLLCIDENNTQKQVFNARVRNLITGENRETPHNSAIFEMLNTNVRFDLLDIIMEMTLGYSTISPKKEWYKLVWDRAWRLDDIYWIASVLGRKELSFDKDNWKVPINHVVASSRQRSQFTGNL